MVLVKTAGRGVEAERGGADGVEAVKVAILGCGFIGGSLAAALRRRRLASSITGYDIDPQTAAHGVALGLFDASAAGAAQAVRGADLVVLAAPVGSISALFGQIDAEIGADSVVTDVGSTKAGLIGAARAALGRAFERFVPAHPIAGGERPGLEAADPDLFEECTVVITTTGETRADSVLRVEQMWRSCGARIAKMDAAEHDRILACVSHLPHLLAYALVAHIAGRADSERLLSLAGPGFRDFTRIAASSPQLWRDIVLANREALGSELNELIAKLQQIETALAAGDSRALQELFELASRTRRAFGGRRDGA